MIPVALAAALRDAGLAWLPATGDWFVVDQPGMADDLFLLSDMTVELQEHATGRIIRFNGTTEWALDSVQQDEAVWLPSEGQLRRLLGTAFTRLEPSTDGWRVVVVSDGIEHAVDGADVETAYGLAVLHALRRTSRTG